MLNTHAGPRGGMVYAPGTLSYSRHKAAGRSELNKAQVRITVGEEERTCAVLKRRRLPKEEERGMDGRAQGYAS